MTRLLVLCGTLTLASPAMLAAQTDRTDPAGAEQRLTKAENEIQALWESYFSAVKDGLPNTKASLDCASGRYQELKPTNSYLVFFALCERINPDENGYRATIAVGNPHTFGFGRISGTLSYGENLAAALVRDTQRVTFSSATELRPGTWTRIEVPIGSVQPKDLTKIIVEFEAGAAVERRTEPSDRSTSAPRFGMWNPRQ